MALPPVSPLPGALVQRLLQVLSGAVAVPATPGTGIGSGSGAGDAPAGSSGPAVTMAALRGRVGLTLRGVLALPIHEHRLAPNA
jgi:hypothetical protein